MLHFRRFIIFLFCIIIFFTARNAAALSVGAWIPYWTASEGVPFATERIELFDVVSPFAYEVKKDGTLRDRVNIGGAPWNDLVAAARKNKTKVIPSVLWWNAGGVQIKNILGNKKKRTAHIKEIVKLVVDNTFDGIDTDYEGETIKDKASVSAYIKELSAELKKKKKTLVCTIEPRTQDTPYKGFKGISTMAWANDYKVFNQYCDEIRIMTYDQPFTTHTSLTWEDPSGEPFAPNADIKWVEQVLKYTVPKINPKKLVLGIPTYGWEFRIRQVAGGHEYNRTRSISYRSAVERAAEFGVVMKRDASGELTYSREKDGATYTAWFSDAGAIQQKIDLAKKYKLKGVVFFKVEGREDPGMWPLLSEL